MSFLQFIKKNLTGLPYPVGKTIAKVPYEYRLGLGGVYLKRQKELALFSSSNSEAKKRIIFKNVKRITCYAYKNVPFYMDKYKACGLNPEELQNFSDLREIPIVTKTELQQVDLEYRSAVVNKRYIVNTGGSSGRPLEFYIQASSVGHEWAHMHQVWGKLDFNQSCLRLVFGGRADVSNVILYDSARHQVNVDIYAGWQTIADKLDAHFHKLSPTYLHGYPSAIFDFVIWLQDNKHPLLKKFILNIKGIFLGSEFPSPILRGQVEQILNCKSVSWYGHTERSVLAYEQFEKEKYYPFQTYGFAEAEKYEDGSRLIGTSYYNFASPLIRYDTEDYILPEVNDNILESFEVSKGRNGEFICDKQGNKISLTALIFGRNHEIFNYVTSIQIHQPIIGKATIFYVPRSIDFPQPIDELFDSSNVNISFVYKAIDNPYKTKNGKSPLLIKKL